MALMTRRRTHKKPTRKPTKKPATRVQSKGSLMAQVQKKFPGGKIRPAPPSAGGGSGGCILVEHESGDTYLCCLDENDDIACRIATIDSGSDDDSSGAGPGRAQVPNYIRGTKRRRRFRRGHIG